MTLRILFLNIDYPSFLAWLYRRHRSLAFLSYDQQMAARNESLFGTADFMSAHMRDLGHEAIDIHANNRPLQEAWMSEGFGAMRRAIISGACCLGPTKIRHWYLSLDVGSSRFEEILAAQISAFKPTILYNHDPSNISADWLKSVAPADCALVGQIASPRNPATNWKAYDLMISSLPNFVAAFRRDGVSAEYLPLSFAPRVLERVPEVARDIPVSFVGGLTPVHRDRIEFLERIAARDKDVAIWGDGASGLPAESPIRSHYRGSAWGPEMFRILRRSCITLNKHIAIAENNANNMRLFEATGMGACLITDAKGNLAELFTPGKEVLAYASTDECMDLIRYYGVHETERERIAEAGQIRCLRDHTYERRMAELSTILLRYFR